jgi:hypothetical protein
MLLMDPLRGAMDADLYAGEEAAFYNQQERFAW